MDIYLKSMPPKTTHNQEPAMAVEIRNKFNQESQDQLEGIMAHRRRITNAIGVSLVAASGFCLIAAGVGIYAASHPELVTNTVNFLNSLGAP
jgi:hypothetical protein